MSTHPPQTQPFIPYGRQDITEADIAAVAKALRSDFLTTGPEVTAFEQEFADAVGATHAVAVCNGTAALHLAMLSAGIGSGDRLITTPNTFLASANCAAYVGAIPDFADVDPVGFTISPASIEERWKPDTKAVVAVDYAGQTPDLPRIAEIARARGAIVIEDACHAVGGRFEHKGSEYRIGSHAWSDITTFSFHPVKTLTTGEGGMLVTENKEYADRARLLRTHGMNREPECFLGLGPHPDPTFAEQGPWYYEMTELGWNYRITDLQCALGRSQLSRLQDFTERRRAIVARYNDAFQNLTWLNTPQLRNQADRTITSWHLYTVLIDFEKIGQTRTETMTTLREQGVGSQVLYIPVHLQPWYRQTYGYGRGKCPVAESLYPRSLSLPLYSQMTDHDVDHVISTVLSLAS